MGFGFGKFHHIGIATERTDECVLFYRSAGYEVFWGGDDVVQGAKITLLRRAEHPMIEIIEPLNSESPVFGILERQGNGPYHTCYEVEDLDAVSRPLRKGRVLPIGLAVPAVAFGGRRVRFFYSQSIGIVELVEVQRT